MKRWTKRISIAITTLMILASQVSIALARAGGGKGGSLGGSLGRSFGGGSFSGGGFGGGFSGGYSSGGLGGFSFLPFFWGGPSYGGGSAFGGIFGLIFLLVIVYVVFKALKSSRRTWQSRRSGGCGSGSHGPHAGSDERRDINDYPAAIPVDITGKPITNDENLRRFGQAINYTRENMRYYAENFPRWDREFLVGKVRQVFFWLQDAWARQDVSGGEAYLAPALLEKYRSDLASMRIRGERNVIKEPILHPGDMEFIHSHLDESNQHFIVMIAASMIDYTVDTAGRIIAGEDDNRLYFTEFWEFTWQGEQWVLANIYQEDALEITKISRGDEY